MRYPDGSFCFTQSLTNVIMPSPVAHIDKIKTINTVPIKRFVLDNKGPLKMMPISFAAASKCSRGHAKIFWKDPE